MVYFPQRDLRLGVRGEMTTNESCSSSCSLPTPAQDLAQEDESSSDTESDTSPVDTTDSPAYKPGTIDQHGKSFIHPRLSWKLLECKAMMYNDAICLGQHP